MNILVPRTHWLFRYTREFFAWIWECVAVLPWQQCWRAYRAHAVAMIVVRASRILKQEGK